MVYKKEREIKQCIIVGHCFQSTKSQTSVIGALKFLSLDYQSSHCRETHKQDDSNDVLLHYR